jgi:6,7-dimethyl-8-ribityllumazine synthase
VSDPAPRPHAHAGIGGPGAEDALDGRDLRVAVIAARFNGEVVERLVAGARACLRGAGVADEDVSVFWVPGAFELPLGAKRAARSGRFDAVVCIGAVIRGETAHFDFVAGEAARGIQDVALATDVPVSFGLLTTDTVEQALDRAGGAHGNKGCDAALAALQMVRLLDQPGPPPR